MAHPLKNVLNRILWDKREDPKQYEIVYRHRGAPQDMKTIRASQIAKLGKSYFTLQESREDEETTIPFHRILEIRKTSDGSLIWVSRSRSTKTRNLKKALTSRQM